MIEVKNAASKIHRPKIYVVGIGGGGNNAVDRMVESGFENVHFISVNTDYQVLESCKAEQTIQIGEKLTGGYGAGADPLTGEAAAQESEDSIMDVLSDADMVMLTCGLGGGTGTGAIPVIAKLCKEKGILTFAIVTLPFSFEGLPRTQTAAQGLEALKPYVDMLLVIPNDKLLGISEKNFFLEQAFSMADDTLRHTIRGITGIIFNQGTVNLDFNDLRTTTKDKGLAHLGIGSVEEGKPIMEAVRQAIESPLLDTSIVGASNILLNTSGHISLPELSESISYIQTITGPDCNIIWGTVTDTSSLESGEIVVTLIATGLTDTGHSAADSSPFSAKKNFPTNRKVGTGTASNIGKNQTDGPKTYSVDEFKIKTPNISRTVSAKQLKIPDFLLHP